MLGRLGWSIDISVPSGRRKPNPAFPPTGLVDDQKGTLEAGAKVLGRLGQSINLSVPSGRNKPHPGFPRTGLVDDLKGALEAKAA